MTAPRLSSIAFLALAGTMAPQPPGRPGPDPEASGARITVGPNVLVSGGFPLHHQELFIESAPWDPEVLIATGIVSTGGASNNRMAVYTSLDGGASWDG